MKESNIKLFLSNVLILILLTGISLWTVWPLVKCLSCVADFGNDGLLITWIINMAGKNIYGLYSDSLGQLFSANIFYPYTSVLAYSEMFFITALWVYPLSKLIQNPTVVYSLTAIFGQLTTVYVIYFLNWKITNNKLASMFATIAFSVSQLRLEYQVHLQMWSMQYFLTGTWLVVSWIKNKTAKNWMLTVGLLLLSFQIWESLLPVYFSFTIIGVTIIVFGIEKNKLLCLIKRGLLVGLVSLPPLVAYMSVSQEFKYQRNIREAAHNSISIEEPFTKFLSPGLYILFAVGFMRLVRSKNNLNIEGRKNVVWWMAIGAIALILSLGPVLKTGGETIKIFGLPIPMPYVIAYYFLPGYGAFRTPSRWMWLAGLAITGLTALGLSGVNYSSNLLKKITQVIVLLIIAMFLAKTVIRVKNVYVSKNVPNVYVWLKGQPGKVIAEVPGGDENQTVPRMVYGLFHEKRMIDGWSGFYPPQRQLLYKELNREVKAEQIRKLKDLEVEYLIVHKALYSGETTEVTYPVLWEDEQFVVFGLRQ